MDKDRLLGFLQDDLDKMYKKIESMSDNTSDKSTKNELTELLDLLNYWQHHSKSLTK